MLNSRQATAFDYKRGETTATHSTLKVGISHEI